MAHYHDLGLCQRVLSLPALVCARLPRPLWDESEAPARGQRAGPDTLAAVPAAALLLFDRGVINCGLFAQLTLARITVVTRAKSALARLIVRTSYARRTAPATLGTLWSGGARCTAPATLGTLWSRAVAARTECNPWEGPITIPHSSSPNRVIVTET
jgi:hypothetical protein